MRRIFTASTMFVVVLATLVLVAQNSNLGMSIQNSNRGLIIQNSNRGPIIQNSNRGIAQNSNQSMTPSSGNQKGNDEQAVRQLLKEISAALSRNDATALDRSHADDYTLVNEFGVLTTKAPRIAAIKSGELKYESVSFDEVDVRMYGNTAVANYRVASKGQFKGQPIGGQFRATSTYVNTKGRWQLVAAQVTRITEP